MNHLTPPLPPIEYKLWGQPFCFSSLFIPLSSVWYLPRSKCSMNVESGIYVSVYESLNKATYKIFLAAFQVRGEDGRKMVTLPIFWMRSLNNREGIWWVQL